jgi:DNA-binding response OmpR family regulator
MAILIVEDEEPLARLYSQILNNQGFKAEYVSDSEQALSIIERRNPELVITDLAIGGRLNGIEMAMEARTKGYKGPIALVTGAVDLQDTRVKSMVEAGCSVFIDCLQKPLRLDDLISLAKNIVKKEV